MENRGKLVEEAKRIEEDSDHSAKGHFFAAQWWGRIHLWLGSIATILSAIAGTSALSEFSNHSLIAGILSMIVAALTAIITFIAPQDKSTAHLKAGNKYNALRNNARMFYNIDVDNLSNEKILDLLNKLNSRRSKLNSESPQIPFWAFTKGKEGIEKGESDYKVDKKS